MERAEGPLSGDTESVQPHLPSGLCVLHRCRTQEPSPSSHRRHRNQCTGWWCSRLRGFGGCSGWRPPPRGSHPPAPSWLPPPFMGVSESGYGRVSVFRRDRSRSNLRVLRCKILWTILRAVLPGGLTFEFSDFLFLLFIFVLNYNSSVYISLTFLIQFRFCVHQSTLATMKWGNQQRSAEIQPQIKEMQKLTQHKLFHNRKSN